MLDKFFLKYEGFIKSTDHRPTDPPTYRPNNRRPNNKIIFKRLDHCEIFILQNTNAAGKMKNYTSAHLICI